jgi:hypothetical protein
VLTDSEIAEMEKAIRDALGSDEADRTPDKE